MNFTKRNKEALKIEWNTELFQGMKYSEIQEFKRKYRKLIIKNYELSVKKAEVEQQLLSAKKSFLYGNKNKNNNQDKIKVVIGGLAIATVCLANAASVTNAQNSINTAVAAIQMQETVQETETVESEEITQAIKTIQSKETVESEEMVETIETVEIEEVAQVIETVQETETVDTQEVAQVIEIVDTQEVVEAVETVQEIETVDTQEVVEAIEMVEAETTEIENIQVIESAEDEDFVIFDKAMEIIMDRCEESFQEFYTSKYLRVAGTFILPSYESMDDYKISGWFERYFGSQALLYSLKYDAAYKVDAQGVSFQNTQEGFKVFIDKNAVTATLNLDLADAEQASILGGVSQEARDYLESDECKAFLPSIDKTLEIYHNNLKKEILESNEFFEFVKSSIEQELKAISTYDVEVVFN